LNFYIKLAVGGALQFH